MRSLWQSYEEVHKIKELRLPNKSLPATWGSVWEADTTATTDGYKESQYQSNLIKDPEAKPLG